MLTDRQLLILQVIIDDFILSAQPVGSRTLSKKDDMNFSSATIRNEMADLEEMGFLEKTHSSSGRVPSEKGYRFYVDHLLAPSAISEVELHKIRSVFTTRIYELEKVVKQSANILSDLTNYTSIVLGPELFETKLKQIQVIPLSSRTAVAIIVTNTGHVENRTITIPEDVSSSELEMMVNILNERLSGVSFIELNARLHKEVANVMKTHVQNYQALLGVMGETFDQQQWEKVFYGGKTKMLSQPEFNDIQKVKTLLATIEEEKLIYELLRPNSAAGISVRIGQENKVEAMRDCSLITASYSIGAQHVGTIAILGPTRMEYSRVISLLDLLSGDLSKALTSLYQS